MTKEKAISILRRWKNIGKNGMTSERLWYIEGWFHEYDAEAFEMAIESLEHTTCYLDSPCEYQNLDIKIPRCVTLTEEAYSDLCLRASHERKTGKWVTDGCIDICSECGASRENQLWDEYCGRCGAKMEGIEDNNDNSIAILKAMQESADAVRNSPQYDFSCVTSLFDEEGVE